ncbi:MAG: energy transducer TonB [Anaerolineales bacterium]
MNKVKSKYSYPRKLQEKGITGWVAVKFNILEDGSVSEPTVIDSSPPNVFDDYAVRAVSFGRYKYIGPSESPVKAIGNVVIVTYGLIKK